MKTLKLTMIIAILSFAMVSYAAIKPETVEKQVKKTYLYKANQNPGLRAVMYDQVSLKILKYEQQGVYSATVNYDNCVYIILGNRIEWIKFLRNKPPEGTRMVNTSRTSGDL